MGISPAPSSVPRGLRTPPSRWSGSHRRSAIDCEIQPPSTGRRQQSSPVSRRRILARPRKRTRSGEFSFWTKPCGRFPPAVLENAPFEASAATDFSPIQRSAVRGMRLERAERGSSLLRRLSAARRSRPPPWQARTAIARHSSSPSRYWPIRRASARPLRTSDDRVRQRSSLPAGILRRRHAGAPKTRHRLDRGPLS